MQLVRHIVPTMLLVRELSQRILTTSNQLQVTSLFHKIYMRIAHITKALYEKLQEPVPLYQPPLIATYISVGAASGHNKKFSAKPFKRMGSSSPQHPHGNHPTTPHPTPISKHITPLWHTIP